MTSRGESGSNSTSVKRAVYSKQCPALGFEGSLFVPYYSPCGMVQWGPNSNKGGRVNYSGSPFAQCVGRSAKEWMSIIAVRAGSGSSLIPDNSFKHARGSVISIFSGARSLSSRQVFVVGLSVKMVSYDVASSIFGPPTPPLSCAQVTVAFSSPGGGGSKTVLCLHVPPWAAL